MLAREPAQYWERRLSLVDQFAKLSRLSLSDEDIELLTFNTLYYPNKELSTANLQVRTHIAHTQP